jgi:nucleoside-diphosphate-sugar epimerase
MGQYHASKLAAHKATLDFIQENRPRWTTICLHPVFVFGRSLVQTTAEELSGTPGMLWQSLNSEKPTMSQFLGVHIDDVAEAHLKALEVPNHGDDSDIKGVRSYLLAAQRRPWADAVQFVKAQYPDVQWPLPSVDATNYTVDTTRAGKELGITFKGMEEQVKDVVDQQLEFRK